MFPIGDAIAMALLPLGVMVILVGMQPNPLQERVYVPVLFGACGLLPAVAFNFPQYLVYYCVMILGLTILGTLELLYMDRTGRNGVFLFLTLQQFYNRYL